MLRQDPHFLQRILLGRVSWTLTVLRLLPNLTSSILRRDGGSAEPATDATQSMRVVLPGQMLELAVPHGSAPGL